MRTTLKLEKMYREKIIKWLESNSSLRLTGDVKRYYDMIYDYTNGYRPRDIGNPIILTDYNIRKMRYENVVLLPAMENENQDEDCYLDRIGL